jgi:hypothetical protein
MYTPEDIVFSKISPRERNLTPAVKKFNDQFLQKGVGFSARLEDMDGYAEAYADLPQWEGRGNKLKEDISKDKRAIIMARERGDYKDKTVLAMALEKIMTGDMKQTAENSDWFGEDVFVTESSLFDD